MFKEQMKKFKKIFFKEKTEEETERKTDKKKIENLVVFLILLIITLISINIIIKKEDGTTQKDEQSAYKVLADMESKNSKPDELEERLEEILSTIEGVRKS